MKLWIVLSVFAYAALVLILIGLYPIIAAAMIILLGVVGITYAVLLIIHDRHGPDIIN